MTIPREISQGFAVIGTVGLLVAAFVVPGQWLAGDVPVEAQIGVLVSSICVLLAGVAARSVFFAFRVLLSTLLMVSLGYLAVIPFAVAQVGGSNRAVAWAVALIVVAAASAAGLWRLRLAAQQAAAGGARTCA